MCVCVCACASLFFLLCSTPCSHRANVMTVDHKAMSVLSCIPEGTSDVEEVIWKRPEEIHGPIDEKSICETYAVGLM